MLMALHEERVQEPDRQPAIVARRWQESGRAGFWLAVSALIRATAGLGGLRSAGATP
jgi:hypothetical protein